MLIAVSLANAEVTPMTEYLQLPRTDMAMAGVGGIGAAGANGGGAGTLELGGLSGTVTLALLYWHGIDIEDAADGFSGGDADYDQAQILFDGAPLVGTRVAQHGDNNGWPTLPQPDSAALYRADVTEQVQARGNGSYAFDGLAAGAGHSANGVSLIVYFDDGEPANDLRVTHLEGLQGTLDADWSLDFDVDYQGGAVDLWLHVADGQSVHGDGTLLFQFQPSFDGIDGSNSAEGLRFTSPMYDGNAMWAGVSVPNMSFPRPTSGPTLWDIRRFPLTGRFGPEGSYRVSTNYSAVGADALTLLVAQLVQPADAAAHMLSPNPFDFGDVLIDTDSPPQRFTLRNLLPHTIRIDGAPSVGNSPFRIVADTCSGQTLAQNASCEIDVVCSPGGFMYYYRRKLVVHWSQDNLDLPRASYAPLTCAGVPAETFSRLRIAPYEHHFGEVVLDQQSAPRNFTLRNTGQLPLTLTDVRIDGSHEGNFLITGNDCGTRTLQPDEGCDVAVAFRAPSSVVTTRKAGLYALFSASDDASDAEGAELRGKGVVDPGLIFRDGFESTP